MRDDPGTSAAAVMAPASGAATPAASPRFVVHARSVPSEEAVTTREGSKHASHTTAERCAPCQFATLGGGPGWKSPQPELSQVHQATASPCGTTSTARGG